MDLKDFRIIQCDLVNMIAGMKPPKVEEFVFEQDKLGERLTVRKREFFFWDKEKLLTLPVEKLVSIYRHLKDFEKLCSKCSYEKLCKGNSDEI